MSEHDYEFETFNGPSDFYTSRMKQESPSSFNGMVRVRKYKVSIELVDEPIEVIRARIQKLWDECDNPHQWGALEFTAKKYGLKLDHSTMRKDTP